ncbi:ion channel [Streptomyces cucumeris]|uniref:ion channel n=1 Tax=Streptomyces cucumeris TaxID=2962890 RepID=UPI003D738E19
MERLRGCVVQGRPDAPHRRPCGGWFGRTWAGTLDQRLEIDDEGVVYITDDGMILAYPVPEPDVPTLAAAGPRRPLHGDGKPDGTFSITAPEHNRTLHFAPLPAGGRELALTAIIDRTGEGDRITIAYDPQGMPTEITHSGGYRIAIDTDPELPTTEVCPWKSAKVRGPGHRRTARPERRARSPGVMPQWRVMSAPPTLRDHRLRQWERRTGGWLIVLAVIYLIAYAVPILAPGLARGWRYAAEAVTLGIWGLLVVEFAVRFAMAGDRWRFLKVRLFDLATLLLPALRPLRLVTIISMVVRRNASALGRLRVRLGTYVIACTVLLLFLSSLAILDVERRHSGATITDFGDALWWSITTVTTVGYGDLYPTTTEGRLIAVGLMIGGVALAGLVTASLASWFTERFSELRDNEAHTTSEIATLAAEVRQLREELRAAHGTDALDHIEERAAGTTADAMTDRRPAADLPGLPRAQSGPSGTVRSVGPRAGP